MLVERKHWLTMASLGIAVAVIMCISLLGTAGAAPATPFTQCPAAGHDTSCGLLITINPGGTATVSTDPSQPSMNSTNGALVGIVNDSNAITSSVHLSGAGIFDFDGQGLCAAHPTPCSSPKEFGPTGYEGPGTSFSATDESDGSVSFAGGLSPGASAYFSLQKASFSVTAVNLLPDIALTVSPITATAGTLITPNIASFTDGGSTAAPSDFTALINWGDGSTSTVTPTQPGGAGTPYVVAGGHTYSAAGTFTTTVTVTDNSLALNTATATGLATVTGASTVVVCSGSGCSGTVTTPTESFSASSSSNTGALVLSLSQSALDCGDMDRHAPQTSTLTETALVPGKPVYITNTFPRVDLIGPASAPVEVCYQSDPGHPFVDLEGQSVTLGLLPLCSALSGPHPKIGPCVNLARPISVQHKIITEHLIIPSNDPKWH